MENHLESDGRNHESVSESVDETGELSSEQHYESPTVSTAETSSSVQPSPLESEPTLSSMRSPTSYSYTASTLRQRKVPLRESVSPTRASFQASTSGAPPTDDEEVPFECNICLEMASNPVVTLCGHLYCWPWYLAICSYPNLTKKIAFISG